MRLRATLGQFQQGYGRVMNLFCVEELVDTDHGKHGAVHCPV